MKTYLIEIEQYLSTGKDPIRTFVGNNVPAYDPMDCLEKNADEVRRSLIRNSVPGVKKTAIVFTEM